MGLFQTFIGLAALYCCWSVADWVDAKSKESMARARRTELENRLLEVRIAAREVAEKKNAEIERVVAGAKGDGDAT